MVKKWIDRMKVWSHHQKWNLLITLITLVLLGSLAKGCLTKMAQKEEEWQKQTSLQVASQCYTDSAGHEIVYYCCKTTYYGENQESFSLTDVGLDRTAVAAVIDLEKATGGRVCAVGDWPGYWCQWNGRNYLCWTISPEYTCIIEYDAQAVSEEDIIRMAESVASS